MITRIEKFRICYTPNPLGVSNPTLHLSGSPKLLRIKEPLWRVRSKRVLACGVEYTISFLFIWDHALQLTHDWVLIPPPMKRCLRHKFYCVTKTT